MKQNSAANYFSSTLSSFLIIFPSAVIGICLVSRGTPLEYAYFVTCTIMMLAAFNFATVIFLEQYRSKFSALAFPALLGAISIIFFYIVVESINRYIRTLGYSFLTPLVIAAVLLIYVDILVEKNLSLKIYLGINAIALMLLWSLGAADKISMPF